MRRNDAKILTVSLQVVSWMDFTTFSVHKYWPKVMFISKVNGVFKRNYSF